MRRRDIFYVLNLEKMKQDKKNANAIVYKNFNQYSTLSADYVNLRGIDKKYFIRKEFVGGWLFLGFDGLIKPKNLIRVSNDPFDYWTADIVVMHPNFPEKKKVMRMNSIGGSRKKIKKLIIINPQTWECGYGL